MIDDKDALEEERRRRQFDRLGRPARPGRPAGSVAVNGPEPDDG